MLGVTKHPQRREETAVNATFSCPGGAAQSAGAAARLAGFRQELYQCFTSRRDGLFGVADAVLCQEGPVTDLARLSLVPEAGRGHGGVYDAVSAGVIEAWRLRRALAGLPLPAWDDGGIRLAVDVCPWLRPDAVTSPGRMHCHVRGRGNAAWTSPGWPYSFVAALSPGRSSWAMLLDAVRLGPDDDERAVTAAQLREVITRLVEAGHWKPGDPPVLVAMDAHYSPVQLACLLEGLPVVVVARVRSDRVFYSPPPPRPPGARGRPARHGPPVRCDDPATWTAPGVDAAVPSARHGQARVLAWPRMHQALHRGSGGWEDWPAMKEFPVIEGTLIRLAAAGDAPGRRRLKPMWIWASDPGAGASEAATATLWQAYLRRFDIEHAFRFLKQQLGWDKPMLRDPAAADRWTWLVIAAHAQLHLARPLAAATRLPWQRPQGPGHDQAMTPGRVRAGFRHARHAAGTPASAAKTTRPGPGRPKGSKNKRKAPRHPVRKRPAKAYTPVTNRKTKRKG
jgi:hypothetical protein